MALNRSRIRHKDIAVRHVDHTGEAEFFDQAILKGAVDRATRPLAWLELAQMISIFSSASARPNCVMP